MRSVAVCRKHSICPAYEGGRGKSVQRISPSSCGSTPRRLSAYSLVSKSMLLHLVTSAPEYWPWPSATEPKLPSSFLAGVLKPPPWIGELARGRDGECDLLSASCFIVGDVGELRDEPEARRRVRRTRIEEA